MPNAIDLDRLAAQHERIRRLARALVRTEQDADDLVQDAWVRAIERGPRDPGALGAWLATVVRRLAGNSRRGAQRRRSRERDVARPEALPSSQEIAARVDIETKLLAGLESLPEPHRTVLRDRYLGGLDAQEIAARDDLTEAAVRSRIKRARGALRGRLERDGLGSDVHWTEAVAPLLLWPAGGALVAPGGDGAITSGVASSTAASTAMLLGGTLAMKKVAALVVIAVLGALGWRAIEQDARVEPRTVPIAGPGDAADVGMEAPNEAPSAEAELLAVDAPLDGPARAAAFEAAPDGADWKVAGRLRVASGGGTPNVPLNLVMYAGMEIEGEPLERFPLVSDADGHFALQLERPDRSVCFDVEIEDHALRSYSIYEPYRAVIGQPAPDIDILVLVRDATITGLVLDANGRPVAGAYVEGKTAKGRTKGDGTFELLVSARSYGGVNAWADGHGFDEVFVETLGVGGTAHVELHLPPEVTIFGVVRDSRGAPVAGAKVHSGVRSASKTRTDAAGRYRVRALNYEPGKVLRVNAAGETHLSALHEVQMTQEQRDYEVDFEIERGVEVHGIVLGPEGEPVAGAEVWSGWAALAWDRTVTYSADDGTFSLDGVAAGPTRVGANARSWPGVDLETEIAAGDQVTLKFEKPHVLRGVVQDESGTPIPGIGLSAKRGWDYLNASATSDAQGLFELDGFPMKSDLLVEAYGLGWVRAEVDVPEAALDGELGSFVVTMLPAGVLSGLVTDADTGLPLTSFTVRIGWPSWPEGPPEGARAISGITSSWHEPGKSFEVEDGRWSTDGSDELPPGRWAMIEVSAPGYGAVRVNSAEVAPLADAEPIEFALPQPVTARVTLTSAGAPVAGARLVASVVANPGEADPTWTANSGAAGVALLEGLPPGLVNIRIQREGRVDWKVDPFMVSQSASAIEVELPAGASLDVFLRTASGEEAPGGRVTLVGVNAQGASGMKMRVDADADGRARFSGVAPGTWRVSRAVGTGRFPGEDLPLGVTVVPGGETQTVVLQPKGRAQVVLEFAGDQIPPDGTTVRLIVKDGRARAGEVQGGRVELNGVMPGVYQVEGHYYDRAIGESMQLRGSVDVAPGVDHVEAAGRVER